MDQDKAVKKVLGLQEDHLPYGFEDRVMARVVVEAKKRNRQNQLLNYVVLGSVSMALIVGAFIALNHFFAFNLFKLFSGVRINIEFNSLYIYCFYLAFLMMVLLGFDYLFRRLANKRNLDEH
jgi:ABC-type multidrug transport system fused ATPase/permease subunit